MPAKKRYQKKRPYKKTGRKTYKKRSKYQKPSTTIIRTPGISDRCFVKLNYVDSFIANPGTVYDRKAFYANSLFGPEGSLAGHQPMYFDQYATLYARYRVLGCSIRVDAINRSGSQALEYCIWPNTGNSSITSIAKMLEQGYAKSIKFVPIAQRVASVAKGYCSTRKCLGLTKAQMAEKDYSASVGSAPTEIWYWNILFNSADGIDLVNASYRVKLVYYCEFYERVEMSQS